MYVMKRFVSRYFDRPGQGLVRDIHLAHHYRSVPSNGNMCTLIPVGSNHYKSEAKLCSL